MKLNLTKAKDVVKKKTPDQKVDDKTGEVKKVSRGRKAKPNHKRYNLFIHQGNYEKLQNYADSLDESYSKHLDKAIEDYLKKNDLI